ncbi:MAG: ABC transporter permease [Bacteroidetes bacterium]|nr:MAG: ABC transporter permease [Bacteroidota bacterium]
MPSLRPLVSSFARLRFHRLALGWLAAMGLMALLAPFLANPLPFRVVMPNGGTFYPAWQAEARGSFWDPVVQREREMALREVAWYAQKTASVWWAPVRYDGQPLGKDKLLPPGAPSRLHPERGRHWLGTTQSGRDLLGALIHGSRLSLGVGLLAVFIALSLGLMVGTLTGFWQDHRLVRARGQWWATWLGLFLAWFYGWNRRAVLFEEAAQSQQLGQEILISLLIGGGILIVAHLAGRGLSRLPFLNRPRRIPLDTLGLKAIEVLDSLPRLLLLLAIAAIFRDRSLTLVAILIGLTAWTGLARLVRGELLRISQLDFVQAAAALGLKDREILWRHALPQALAPVYIWVAFSLGGAILSESALSFLGLVEEAPSWGGLISDAKSYFEAWWIALFPGLCLFLTVLACNVMGEWLRDRQDPRQVVRPARLTGS